MALADRRPLGFPVTSTSASPAFNPKTLSLNSSASTSSSDNDMTQGFKLSMDDLKGKLSESDIKPLTPEKSLSPVELSPTLRSISPDSLMNSDSYRKLNATTIAPSSTTSITSNSSRGSSPSINSSGSNVNALKKPKNTSRAPIATGISTTIPVTGEKPKPSQKDDPSLEDDVLYAIFVILYEKDPEGSGMTVKQICDILVEQHPDMANLSTKTSNLVSAKLNAYVKRVEKGDSSLKYALSRDWADASPKRMVYVYRGLLTEDFHLHVKNVMEVQKQQHNQIESPSSSKIDEPSSLEADKQANLLKPRRQTMFDLGVTKNTFLESALDKSNLVVPYFSAPVTASLTETNSESKKITSNNQQESDLEFEEFEVFNDIEDDDEENDINLDMNDMYIDSFRKNGKRSKSLSYLSSNKKPKILTAAAAAPRAPRTPSSHNANAAAAAAALHAAAFKAISAPSSQSSESLLKSNASSSVNTNVGCPSNKKWLNVVRSGFLTQDIGTPEEISLSDLDKFFT